MQPTLRKDLMKLALILAKDSSVNLDTTVKPDHTEEEKFFLGTFEILRNNCNLNSKGSVHGN
jgi:hypothetical protein